MSLSQKAENHKKLRSLPFQHPKTPQKTSKNVKKGSKKGHFRVFLTIFDPFCTFVTLTLFTTPIFENHEKKGHQPGHLHYKETTISDKTNSISVVCMDESVDIH